MYQTLHSIVYYVWCDFITMVIGAAGGRCFPTWWADGQSNRCYVVDVAVDVADVTEFDLQPMAGSKSGVKSKPKSKLKSERAWKGPLVVLFAKVEEK